MSVNLLGQTGTTSWPHLAQSLSACTRCGLWCGLICTLLTLLFAVVPVLLRAPQAPSGLADIWQTGRAPLLGALVSRASWRSIAQTQQSTTQPSTVRLVTVWQQRWCSDCLCKDPQGRSAHCVYSSQHLVWGHGKRKSLLCANPCSILGRRYISLVIVQSDVFTQDHHSLTYTNGEEPTCTAAR